MKKKNNKIIPLEIDEQATFVEYLKIKRLLFSAITQDTYTTSWSQKRRNKMLGVEKGLPDLIIFIPKKNILLFIEMKRQNSSPSQTKQSQKDWLEALNQVSGVLAVVCRGAQEAIDLVEKSLK